MEKTRKFKLSIPLVVVFCFFIHPVMIKGPAIISYIYQYGIPFIYVLSQVKSVMRLSKNQAAIYALLILLIMLSILFPYIHSTNDYSYLKVATFVFRKIFIYIFLVSLLVKHYKKEVSVEYFMYYFSIVQATYVIGTIALVFIPGLKTLWFSIFEEVTESEELLQSFGYTFRIGWQGFSGFEFTIFCSISCLFLLYLYYDKKADINLTRYQFLTPFFLCLLGNMFYGRSGLVVTIFASVVALIAWNKTDFIKILRIILIIIAFVFGIYLLRNVGVFKDWYYWMSNPIINLFTTGSFNNVSISTTYDMIFNPGFNTILFGDGYYTKDGHYYMQTDSGFMRSILYWGIIGTVTCYLTTLIALFEVKKQNFMLFILMLVSFLAFEYKGHIYFDFILIMLAMTYVGTLKKYYYGRNHS